MALHDRRRDELAGAAEPVSTVEARDRALRAAVGRIPHLDDRILSILSDSVSVSSTATERQDVNPVRLVHRTGALDHLRRVEGGGTGAWIQDVTAAALKVGPGDELFLHDAGGRIPLRVAGVYEALANSPPDPFWEPLANHFRPPPATDAPLPPPFVLVGRDAFEALSDRLGHRQADFQWEFPLEPGADLDLGSAARLVDDFESFGVALQTARSPVGKYFACTTCALPRQIGLDLRSTLEPDVERARETVESLRPSIQLLAAAGLLTALVVLAAAGLYSASRRRVEMRLLTARGAAPASLAAKAALESALPVAAGAGVGWLASALALARFGPGERLEPAAFWDAGRVTAVTVPVAVLVIAVTVGFSLRRFSPRASSSRRGTRLLWELPFLLLAGLALRQVVEAGHLASSASGEVKRVSPWLLAFPVLFVGAGGGLVARAFRRALITLRAPRLRVRPSLYFALNRLASARRLAVMLVTASTLAFGIFLYAQCMAASVRATTTAKSYVFTGSDVAVSVDRAYRPPASLDWPHTVVSSRIDAGRLEPSNQTVDMLGVDVATFERGAYWDDSFSDRHLGDLMEALDRPAGATLPVIVAGRLPAGNALELGGVQITIDVVARVDTFPGQFLDRTLLVVNRDTAGEAIENVGALDPITTGGTGGLWVRGDTDRILASLGDLGFGPDDSLTAATVRDNPSFVAVTRTFGFLQSLGGLAALLVLVGIVLYVQTRQRNRTVSYALARRMGLRARAHYTALLAELLAMLALALAAGCALGAVAARLVYARVDLLPTIPPRPLLEVPLDAVAPVGLCLLLAAGLGALLAHRTAERANVAKALRSDG